MNKTCKICGKDLTGKQRIFCSMKCRQRDYYDKNKDDYTERSKKWAKKNPKKRKEASRKGLIKFLQKKKKQMNGLVLKDYHQNKEKWKIRNNSYRTTKITKSDKCEICGGQENLERHHDNYDEPNKVKILCRNCHIKSHSK